MKKAILALLGAVAFSACVAPQAARAPTSLLAPNDLKLKTRDIYPTVEMKTAFDGENLHPTAAHDFVVTYLTPAEREQHRVIIQGDSNETSGGYIYDSSGAAIDDQVVLNGQVIVPNLSQNGEYVMDAAGNFYLLNEEDIQTIRHSSILDGKPVAGAGEIKISKGRILTINSKSGHYPTNKNPKYLDNVVDQLKLDEVNLLPSQILSK